MILYRKNVDSHESLFSRVHATLQVTVSVRRSVGLSRFTFFRVVTCSVVCARLMAIGLVFILFFVDP